MKTVMLTMLARLPPARFITWSICETTCFTWASKLLAISLPALSRVAVWPATQTILPPSVTTPGEKARDSWNGVFSRYSAAPAASGSASRRAAVMLFFIGGLLICRWWNEARCGCLRCRARWRESRAGRCFRSPSASARRASASAPGIADAALDVHVDQDTGRAHFLGIGNEAAAVAVGSVLEHRGIEAARALEVGNRQVEPHDAVGTGMHVTHLA